ncbi:PREDICTED: zinc finger protein 2-like [Papilio xuthus]|uniref:Zinc finger protein 2-like n=1 Tax=Papilio xuthus TaxID=66420 RepID=A0AAJ7EJB1_PAPXU|nr:PREDICTED: zinc finger protein 2-like [Papilio xuthus]
MSDCCNSVDIEDVCRTCLATENVSYPICSTFVETLYGDIPLVEALATVSSLQFTRLEGFPDKMCKACKDTTAKAYSFKRKLWQTEAYLNTLLIQPVRKREVKKVVVKIELSDSDEDNNNRIEDPNQSNPDGRENNAQNVEQVERPDVEVVDEIPQQSNNESALEVRKNNCQSFCPLCRVSYNNVAGLTKHMWERHAEIMGPKKRGRPKKISTEFILKNLLDRGLLKPKQDKRLCCVFCKKYFGNEEELIDHISTHRDKLYSCAVCKKNYMQKKYFDSHLCVEDKSAGDGILSESSSSQPSRAEQDEFLVESSIQLLHLTNETRHASLQWRPCNSCSLLLMTEAEYTEHIDTRHPNMSLKCRHCNKMFETLTAARAHRARCSNVVRSYACLSCPQRFTREVFLNKHILSFHRGHAASVQFLSGPSNNGLRYQCDICKQRFVKKASLTKHMRHHTATKNYECNVCNKRFQRNDNLKSHMRVHGVGGQSSATSLCLYCGRSFSCSSNFIVHMRRHTGEKPYKCDFCDKGFPRSSDLQCHRRSHTGERPYLCQICDKGFARSNKLTRHMRVHTGARPYKCSYCEKAFSQSNDLNLHVRRHTGDKPYVCEVCGDRFIQGTALQSHRRTHGHYPQETPALLALPPVATPQIAAGPAYE